MSSKERAGEDANEVPKVADILFLLRIEWSELTVPPHFYFYLSKILVF